MLLAADKVLWIRTKLVKCVFSGDIRIVSTAHILLGATSDQSTATVGREGPSIGTHCFHLTYIIRLTADQYQQGSADATLSFRLPAWLFCIRSRVHDGAH